MHGIVPDTPRRGIPHPRVAPNPLHSGASGAVEPHHGAMASAKTVTATVVRRLTGWGAASVGVGGALALAPRTRAFGVQTLLWGAIDVALAAFTRRQDSVPTTRMLRRILLVNAALDVGYAATGAHLVARTPSFGGRLTPADARGHGRAIVIQGAALFVIDLTAARRLSR